MTLSPPPWPRVRATQFASIAVAVALGAASCDRPADNSDEHRAAEERVEVLETRLLRLEGLLLEATADRLHSTTRAGHEPRPALPGPREWPDSERAILQELQSSGLRAERIGDLTGLEGRSLTNTRFLDANGDVFDLASLRGKRALVVILRGHAAKVCIFCAAQTFELSDHADAYRVRDTQVVLVYPGRAGTAPLFLDALNRLEDRGMPPPFPVLLDVDLRLVDELGLRADLAKPTTILLNATGRIEWAYVGKSPDDRPGSGQVLAVIDRARVRAGEQ